MAWVCPFQYYAELSASLSRAIAKRSFQNTNAAPVLLFSRVQGLRKPALVFMKKCVRDITRRCFMLVRLNECRAVPVTAMLMIFYNRPISSL